MSSMIKRLTDWMLRNAPTGDNAPTEEGVILPATAGEQVQVPEEAKGVVLPTLNEVAQVVTGQAKTGELVGIVRPWRKGDRPWAIVVNGTAYARVDGAPIDADTMWKAGYRPPFRFKNMAGGWKPNDHKQWVTTTTTDGRRAGAYQWKDQASIGIGDLEAAEIHAEQQRKELGLDSVPTPRSLDDLPVKLPKKGSDA